MQKRQLFKWGLLKIISPKKKFCPDWSKINTKARNEKKTDRESHINEEWLTINKEKPYKMTNLESWLSVDLINFFVCSTSHDYFPKHGWPLEIQIVVISTSWHSYRRCKKIFQLKKKIEIFLYLIEHITAMISAIFWYYYYLSLFNVILTITSEPLSPVNNDSPVSPKIILILYKHPLNNKH